MSSSIQFDAQGRMKYHPDYHDKQGAPWSAEDRQFLLDCYTTKGPEECSLALGRTIHTVMQQANRLRRLGLMPKPTNRTNHSRLIRRGLC